MLSVNGSHYIKAVTGHSKQIRCQKLLQLRPVTALITRIDDPLRSSYVALIDAQNAGHKQEMTYGQLSKESIRMANTLQKNMDPSVQSIGKLYHLFFYRQFVFISELHRIVSCKLKVEYDITGKSF